MALTVDLRAPELEPKTIEVNTLDEIDALLDKNLRYSTAFVIEDQRVIHIYKRPTGERYWVKDPPSRP